MVKISITRKTAEGIATDMIELYDDEAWRQCNLTNILTIAVKSAGYTGDEVGEKRKKVLDILQKLNRSRS